jgi:hypothetical protein
LKKRAQPEFGLSHSGLLVAKSPSSCRGSCSSSLRLAAYARRLAAAAAGSSPGARAAAGSRPRQRRQRTLRGSPMAGAAAARAQRAAEEARGNKK